MGTKPTLITRPSLAGTKYPASAKQPNKPPSHFVSNDEVMRVKEASAFLRVSKSFLDKLRVSGGGPEFIRLGARKVLYRKQDLEAWMRSRRFENTSQYRK